MKERIVLNDHAKKSIRSIHQSVVFLVKYIFVEVQFESTNNAIHSRQILCGCFYVKFRATVESRSAEFKHIITAIKFSLEAD